MPDCVRYWRGGKRYESKEWKNYSLIGGASTHPEGQGDAP